MAIPIINLPPAATIKPVSDDYFDTVSEDRLRVKNNLVLFKVEGRKIRKLELIHISQFHSSHRMMRQTRS